LLLAVFAFRLLDTAVSKTLTADEPLYVGPGLVLWDTGEYDFAANLSLHPPLVFHIAAVPLLAFDLDDVPREPGIVRRIFERDEPSTRTIRIATRLPFIALACWGAFLCFAWAREVAGDAAGLLAAFLYTFAPSVLANGGLIHSDITVTVFFLQTLYTQWRWLLRPSAPRLVVFGLSLGLALISKLSALLLLASVGVLFLASALRLRSERPALPFVGPEALGKRIVWVVSAGLAAFAVALGVLWLGYGGSFRIVTLDVGPRAGVPLPGYLLALVFDRAINSGGRELYLLGEIASGGWWYYFPVAFAAKVPLAISALFGLALAAPAVRPARLGWWLAVPSAIYLAIAMFWLDITLGLRYLLPLFPLLYVFIATQLVPLGAGVRRGVVVGLCGWLAVASLWIHPHYLAYFNEAVGGPARGHQVLLESNIDWGQDLGTLAEFLAGRGNPPVWLAYLGPEKPADHGIRSRPLTGCSPVSGLVAISLNVREGLYHAQGGFGQRPKDGCYDWLKEYDPIARPGYSIVVYDIPAKAEPAP
jgi:hypothetical protein